MVKVETTDFTPRFVRELKKLPDNLRNVAKEAMRDLKLDPIPTRLRFEKLSGYKNPAIYTIHIVGNHSYKISFELIGTHAVFRRVATHKEIDRQP